MSAETELKDISYFEYKAINDILHAHSDIYGTALRAIIAYGRLKTVGGTFDIELLEVIEGWSGVTDFQSESSVELPLRGRLYIKFLSPEQFESITESNRPEELEEFATRLLEGYEIVYDVPAGYARKLLEKAREPKSLHHGSQKLLNPLSPPPPPAFSATR